MRPSVPDGQPTPPRKSSFTEQAGPPWSDHHAASPTTFFLARERDGASPSTSETVSPRDSMYGVQSLEETISRLDDNQSFLDEHRSRKSSGNKEQDNSSSPPPLLRRTTIRPSDLTCHAKDSDAPSSNVIHRVPSGVYLSRPLTPVGTHTPDIPSSLPSSPKSSSTRSLKPLDDISITDDISSQAIASGGEEEEDEDGLDHLKGPQDSSSQLIMPSIRMPSRRPFTERGKRYGRFKILIAGPSGSGKSSLIKSIVQACEDIVHVDPVEQATSVESKHARPRTRGKPAPASVTLSEIHASTKPYPSWWSDLEDSRVLRRRKSTGEVVLERNLCFVDAPGGPISRAGQTHVIVQYLTQQLMRAVSAMNTGNSDLQNLLGGNGGAQVDVILYLISEETLSADIDCIRKLSELCNVIPLISKADLLSESQIEVLKNSYHAQAQKVGLKPFHFADSASVEDGTKPIESPFAVSSLKSNDDDNMDASILMSPDYVQPLIPSELQVLIAKIFDHENMVWLRHSSAKKLSQSRYIFLQQQATGSNTSLQRSHSPNGLGFQRMIAPPPDDNLSSFTLARLTDHTQREERLAQVRLAKWASDLQRSLQNERERYAALARGERAVWLTERLGECVVDGTLVPISETPGMTGWSRETDKSGGILVRKNGQPHHGHYRLFSLNPQDPLGVVRWNDELRRRGWIVIQVVGGFGVVGGLALWLARFWGVHIQSITDWRLTWLNSGE